MLHGKAKRVILNKVIQCIHFEHFEDTTIDTKLDRKKEIKIKKFPQSPSQNHFLMPSACDYSTIIS